MVVGVSADEELTNMIKYQAAYNAASRYINVISSMIETLVNTMQ
jgi:flagellar hook-associated protein 1 FlgK